MAKGVGKNVIYAQSGGVTSVINASAFGVIQALQVGKGLRALYAGWDGINGVLDENLIDLSQEAPETLEALRYTPAGAFGSCRKKLQDLEKHQAEFMRIVQVCEAHDVGTFLYNGGNDSMDTVAKLAIFAKKQGYPLRVIGIPKTIDNDLPITDNSPGFGSVAKYNAVSMMEASLDTASMQHDSTKVFVLETMGRNAGWIAASTGLAARSQAEGPHLILLPEVRFKPNVFLQAVARSVSEHGFCAITVSEGLLNEDGEFVSEIGGKDAFGHTQLGGVGQYIQELIKREAKLKVHGAVLDYCQRSARHLASATDVSQAIACGEHAVALADQGISGAMVTIQRTSDKPYHWALGHTEASNIANQEKMLHPDMIREDGFHITQKFRDYCLPLIQGEDLPPFIGGLPAYRPLKKVLVPKRMVPFTGGR
jgi:ATP-dependent phosphofructokinase / diphosphate-dependent phosphofructokinase